MGASARSRWQALPPGLRRLAPGATWRRRLIIAAVIVGAQAAVLAVTYRAVVFHNRTLLTGSVVTGTEGATPPYGYPGPPPSGFNEIDAGASAWQYLPQIQKAHDELTSGEVPFWSANIMLGAPLLADPIHGLLNPLTWPLVASPTNGMWDAWLLFRLLLAGVLCSAVALYLGLRAFPATVAGAVYMMSGVFQVRTTTIQTDVMAVLPLLILGVECCVRTPSRRSSGLLAVAVAATILFGMPEEDFLCLVAGALYFVVRVAAESIHGRRPPELRVLYAGLGGGLVGVLCSLPMILPLVEYLGQAWTLHGAGSHSALLVEDAGQLLRLVGPHWTGGGPYYQVGFAPFDNWFGVGAVFVAVLGVFTRAFPRGVRTILVLTAVLVEAKVVGVPGWFNQLVGNLPVISQVTLWAYSGVFVSLAVALLAGAGLQRIEPGTVTVWWAIATGAVLGAAIAAASPGFLAAKMVKWSEVAVTAAVLFVVVAGTSFAAHRSRWASRLGAVLAGGAVIGEVIFLASPRVPLAIRYEPLSPTPTSAYLRQVMPSGSGRSYSATQILYPMSNEAFNVDDLRNIDALYIERTYRYLKLFVDPGLMDRLDGVPPGVANYIHNPFMNALNIKYILVAPGQSNAASLPADQFTLTTVAADGVSIYRNGDAAPRAQVFFNVATATSEQGAATIMGQPGFDPTRRAVVETARTQSVSSSLPAPARIDSYQDNRVVITTTTSQPGLLVVADAYYPGWEAAIDGKPASIYPVDVALRGVPVAAGTHTVIMQFRPKSFEAGAFGVPAGILVFAVGGYAVPSARRVRDRRRGQPGPG